MLKDNLPSNFKKITKLESILISRSMKQTELSTLIEINFPKEKAIGADRISKIVTGQKINYGIKTAIMISEALGVKIEEIVERDLFFKNEELTTDGSN